MIHIGIIQMVQLIIILQYLLEIDSLLGLNTDIPMPNVGNYREFPTLPQSTQSPYHNLGNRTSPHKQPHTALFQRYEKSNPVQSPYCCEYSQTQITPGQKTPTRHTNQTSNNEEPSLTQLLGTQNNTYSSVFTN